MRICEVGIARRGPVSPVPEQLADQRQVFARHDGLAGRRVPEVMQAEPAEPRICARCPPAVRQNPDTPALGMSGKQERVRFTGTGQRRDERPRGLAERHGARAGFRIREIDGILANVAPAQIEHFAAPASGEGQQPDCGDGLGPARLVGVERAPEPGQFVRVQEPGNVVPRVLGDAETGVGVPFAQSPLLGPEHHRAQYLEGAVGRAGLVPARCVEPRGHVLGADAVERHPAEGNVVADVVCRRTLSADGGPTGVLQVAILRPIRDESVDDLWVKTVRESTPRHTQSVEQ